MAKTMYNGKMVEVEDCTPTWAGIVGIYINALENGSKDGKQAAREEIKRMAQLADLYVSEHKIKTI